MKAAAAMLATVLGLALSCAQGAAQETQAEPTPLSPTPVQTTGAQPTPSQTTAAPVERRQVSHPNAVSTEPVDGPLTGTGSPKQPVSQQSAQPVAASRGEGGNAGTIHVETRLVNVAVNVEDAHGAPVGGFEKKDFHLFEDGAAQTIAVFEREATTPLSIMLAIDASETVVTSERLEREAAQHFVRAILRPQDEISLMDFADTVREIVPFTNQARRIEQGLGEIRRGDETALYNAVYLASQRLAAISAAEGRRRVLVIISDGGDSVGGKSYAQAVEEAERAGAVIYAIIIVPIAADAGRDTGGEHTLIQISEDSGGKYYYVVDPKDLEPAFRHISDELRTQYLLGYYAPQQGGGDEFRRIKVKLSDAALNEQYNLRYRPGYFADAK
jgi:Ca-activated chloride channel family protein